MRLQHEQECPKEMFVMCASPTLAVRGNWILAEASLRIDELLMGYTGIKAKRI